MVTVDGVVQRAPVHYTTTGNTITFTSSPPAGANVHVRHLGFRTTSTITTLPANTTISQPVLLSPTITTPSITGNTTAAGFILPSANTTYDLGSPSLRWSNIYGSTLNLSGGQIAFPATQNASADANTLDDYEEGSWTPNVGGNATYGGQFGTYVKVGRLVNVNFDISVSTLGTGSASLLSGFPFTSTGAGFPATGCISYYAGLVPAPIWIAFYLQNAATSAYFVWNTAGSSTVGVNTGNVFQNNSRILGSIAYMTAS
jgi:hypothetical protein